MNIDPASLMASIEGDNKTLDDLAKRLWKAMKEASDAEADWELAFSKELLTIAQEAESEGRRAAEDLRKAMARVAVQARDPDLWARYVGKPLEVERLKKLIQVKQSQISARQSQLSAMKAEAA